MLGAAKGTFQIWQFGDAQMWPHQTHLCENSQPDARRFNSVGLGSDPGMLGS